MDRNKYLIALIGLVIGFLVSFVLTKNYNNANMPAASAGSSSASQSAAMQGGQNPMGNIQQLLANAKNNPKDFDAQLEAASAYAQIGRDEGAVEYLEKAYAADPAKFAQLQGAASFAGGTYFKQQKYDDAEKWLKRALETDPKDAEALSYLVKTYAAKKDARSAEDALNRLKQTDPSNKEIPSLETMVADAKAGKSVTIPTH
ncbi:MAG TPA: tetratricopeptide repeat protein [Blastocatellia bacterium]|nr:tetratricopeptide repeat protein [Blastocatellia bacterium]